MRKGNPKGKKYLRREHFEEKSSTLREGVVEMRERLWWRGILEDKSLARKGQRWRI